MAEIVLDGISKRYADGTEALARTDLTIHDGEFFILVGPSGCGKSTLLNIIVGLEQPSGGDIRVDGEPVTGRDPRHRNMAMVFQSYAIYPHMTVRENIAFPLKLAKLPRNEIDSRVRQAADMLELDALLERKPAELSGGQRQRVAMGRAIVRKPVAFLLDEPLSNLDAKLRVQMRSVLSRLQKRLGTTTVYVTHDQTEAMTLGQRIAVLRGGRIQQVGTPYALYRQPANLFVAGFVGSPAMNFLPAEVRGDRLVLPMTEIALPSGLRTQIGGHTGTLIAGIRPEHFAVPGSPEEGGSLSSGFEVKVEMVEWLGSDLYAHFDIAAGNAAQLQALPRELDLSPVREGCLRLVARLEASAGVSTGATQPLCFDANRICLFDPQTGRRLGASAQVCE